MQKAINSSRSQLAHLLLALISLSGCGDSEISTSSSQLKARDAAYLALSPEEKQAISFITNIESSKNELGVVQHLPHFKYHESTLSQEPVIFEQVKDLLQQPIMEFTAHPGVEAKFALKEVNLRELYLSVGRSCESISLDQYTIEIPTWNDLPHIRGEIAVCVQLNNMGSYPFQKTLESPGINIDFRDQDPGYNRLARIAYKTAIPELISSEDSLSIELELLNEEGELALGKDHSITLELITLSGDIEPSFTPLQKSSNTGSVFFEKILFPEGLSKRTTYLFRVKGTGSLPEDAVETVSWEFFYH